MSRLWRHGPYFLWFVQYICLAVGKWISIKIWFGFQIFIVLLTGLQNWNEQQLSTCLGNIGKILFPFSKCNIWYALQLTGNWIGPQSLFHLDCPWKHPQEDTNKHNSFVSYTSSSQASRRRKFPIRTKWPIGVSPFAPTCSSPSQTHALRYFDQRDSTCVRCVPPGPAHNSVGGGTTGGWVGSAATKLATRRGSKHRASEQM